MKIGNERRTCGNGVNFMFLLPFDGAAGKNRFCESTEEQDLQICLVRIAFADHWSLLKHRQDLHYGVIFISAAAHWRGSSSEKILLN